MDSSITQLEQPAASRKEELLTTAVTEEIMQDRGTATMRRVLVGLMFLELDEGFTAQFAACQANADRNPWKCCFISQLMIFENTKEVEHNHLKLAEKITETVPQQKVGTHYFKESWYFPRNRQEKRKT